MQDKSCIKLGIIISFGFEYKYNCLFGMYVSIVYSAFMLKCKHLERYEVLFNENINTFQTFYAV